MAELDPLPLDDVLELVAERARRRHRRALWATCGVGATAALVVAAAQTSEPPPADAPGSTPAPLSAPPPTTPTTPPVPPAAASTPAATGTLEDWQQQAFTRFVDAGYGYADAEAVARRWQTEPFTVKLVLGEALGSGEVPADGDAAEEEWADSVRAAAFAAFEQAYTYADAVALGDVWGTPVFDAKLLIGVRAAAGAAVTDA